MGNPECLPSLCLKSATDSVPMRQLPEKLLSRLARALYLAHRDGLRSKGDTDAKLLATNRGKRIEGTY
jgi:hypothetical protein